MLRSLTALLCWMPLVSGATIVDTLNADPGQTFSVFGTGGRSISAPSLIGPQFTLANTTLITQIGGFVEHCDKIISGIAECPNRFPFLVQVVAINSTGDPDLTTVFGIFSLPINPDPLLIAYESVDPELTLPPGTYYAMIGGQLADGGYLLQVAPNYHATSFMAGFVSPEGASHSLAFGAVRVLGTELPEPGMTGLVGLGILGLYLTYLRFSQISSA